MDTLQVRPSEIVKYLSDVEEEFSPDRLQIYTAEVKQLLPASACADLDAAYHQLAEAQANIRKAARRIDFGVTFEGSPINID